MPPQEWKRIICGVLTLVLTIGVAQAEYKIGVGRGDVTGPSAEVPFMGYARPDQRGTGIHLRQFSRAFIIDDGRERIVFVSVDACMMGHGVRQQVIQNLTQRYDQLYNEQNVIISGIHTHSTPGGFLMDFLFDISTYGFVKETFDALVDGIVRSIDRAHDSLTSGRVYVSTTEVQNANINRSPVAYLNNPLNEREQYQYDVDKELTQLKFVASKDNHLLGAINWFAVHPTSMNFTNKLISSDNMGYASLLMEQHMNPKQLTATGPFVGAFASSNLGDVSPNIRGPRCLKTGKICDMLTSKCADNDLCAASGPGVDIYDSTRIIAKRIYEKAAVLLEADTSQAHEITGPVKVIHQYVDMPKQRFNITRNNTTVEVRGCKPALGYSFAAGTTDGPGPIFSQGTVTPNKMWNYIRDKIAPPTPDDVACHGRKPIFIATGRMTYPYQWQPEIVSTQLVLIGDFALAAVPGEFTTMSGRRLRRDIRNTLIENGADASTKVVIAGLSNVYADYIATPEEYQVQRYEGASTIYGPFTLPIYQKQYEKLAQALMKGETLPPGPNPPDLTDQLISLLPPVILDFAAWRKNFGDCTLQPQKIVKPGDVVRVKFIAGHPRNDPMHERTFLAVERHDGDDKWTMVATDADWATKFIWRRVNSLLGTSEAEVRWYIGPDVQPAEYRIRHYGNYKFGGIFSYEGLSNSFEVI